MSSKKLKKRIKQLEHDLDTTQLLAQRRDAELMEFLGYRHVMKIYDSGETEFTWEKIEDKNE